ncbi:MAG: hypothetical protein ACRC2T_11775 [Thermoguttaceae bacterium]
MSENCPICGLKLICGPFNTNFYECPKCGKFSLGDESSMCRIWLEEICKSKETNALLSHYLYLKQESKGDTNASPENICDLVTKIFKEPSNITEILGVTQPNPKKQEDLLILHLGKTTQGEWCRLLHSRWEAIICAISDKAFVFIANALEEEGLISRAKIYGALISNNKKKEGSTSLQLTPKGWKRYEELKRGKISGTKAFMAMKFVGKSDPLHNMFQTHFKKAVSATGFELYRLDEDAKAGLINNHLCEAIKTAAFVIADLTHDNSGAYWEAGYAEGLGKPVIYTCEKNVFEGKDKKNKKPHFDTNHHTTIVWDSNNPEEAVKNLKATIRNSLPHLAKMED